MMSILKAMYKMEISEFDEMTEEIATVVEKYGLQLDFGAATLGEKVEITLKIRSPEA